MVSLSGCCCRSRSTERKAIANVVGWRRHVLWVVDGLVQLLTGYSVFGNLLIELDSGQALVTGSLRMGYGATLAILSPFYLEALRRTGSGVLNSVLALPLFAAIVMSGNEASMVHALVALAGTPLFYGDLNQRRGHILVALPTVLFLFGGADGRDAQRHL